MDYGIFTNTKTNKSLVYYPVAKNANSSAKLFFLKHLNLQDNFFFIEDDVPRHAHNEKLYEQYENKKNLINFLPPYVPFKKIIADEKCCLIRDPIKRFISSYKNRILFHKDKNFFDHTVDMILEKLENDFYENRHFLPQSYWLGSDLSYFTIVTNVSNIKPFVDQVNNFFGKIIDFPHIQTSERGLDFELNVNQIKKVKKIYSRDYDLIGSLI